MRVVVQVNQQNRHSAASAKQRGSRTMPQRLVEESELQRKQHSDGAVHFSPVHGSYAECG